jgi:hypothetical protein
MEVSGQLHEPAALFTVKVTPVPTGQEAGRAPQPVWKPWRTQKSPPRIELPCPARSLVTILTGRMRASLGETRQSEARGVLSGSSSSLMTGKDPRFARGVQNSVLIRFCYNTVQAAGGSRTKS